MKTSKLLLSVLGLICGICATGPMSAVMIALHRRLPEDEKYPLPPREITEKLAHAAAPSQELAPPTRSLLSWLAHFGYGGAAGAIYANTPLPVAPALRGPLFGLIVWTTSYFGLLPALGILSSAKEHPIRRSGLMIAAHLVWGWVMATLLETFLSDRKEGEPGFHTSRRVNRDVNGRS
ncbi:MAG TPA: DUF1440 domain-containing protein [Chthoniobacterales bacterium]|jgi:putative membrane protein